MAHRPIPTYHFFLQQQRDRAAPSAPHTLSPRYVLPGQLKQGAEPVGYMLSCTAAPKAARSWGRTDQKAAPLETGIMLKVKCFICNSGKIFREKILKQLESSPSALVPGVSLACPSHPTPAPARSWHQAKGRGVVWGRWGGEGREGHDLL